MASDIFASLQTIIQLQAPQNASPQGQTAELPAQPGLFESILAGIEGQEEIAMLPEAAGVQAEQPTPVFMGSTVYTPPVIEDAAEEAPETIPAVTLEPETVQDEEDDDIVIWPEDEAQPTTRQAAETDDTEQSADPDAALRTVRQIVRDAVARARDFIVEAAENVDPERIASAVIEATGAEEILASLPEEARENITIILSRDNSSTADDSTEQPSAAEETPPASPAPAPATTPAEDEAEDDDDDEAEETAEVYEPSNLTGYETWADLAEALNTQLKDLQPASRDISVQAGTIDNDQPLRPTLQIPLNNKQAKASSAETPETEAPETQEAGNTPQASREVLTAQETGQQTPSGQDQQGQPQGQSQEQDSRDDTPPDPSSSSRNNTRRTEASRTQTNDRPSSQASSRTESRSDFASYFEGVMNSRRTTATSSAETPQPLNIRSSADFTQASTLRNGLTNVVRFIRADGVQRASVIVDPPALGRISVELTEGTSGVEASIKVASEQIRQLVQDQLSELRMNLSQQGVQVAEFTVDVQQDNGGNQQNPQQQERGYYAYAGDTADDDIEEFRVDLEEGLLYWVA